MFNFNYNTLTINNITKICDDNYYIYNYKLIEYQWNIYQLRYILQECLDESTIDPITKLELNPIALSYKIKERISIDSNIKNKYGKYNLDKIMGIVPIKTKNNINMDNLGGKLKKPIIIDDSISVIKDSNIEKSNIHYLYSSEILDSTLKPEPSKKKKLVFAKKTELPKSRILIATSSIESYNKDDFRKFGRLDWNSNSCYADSLLIMLLYPIYYPNISNFTLKEFIEKKLEKKEEIDKIRLYICDEKKNFDENYEIHNNIITGFKQFYSDLKNNKIIDINHLSIELKKCKDKLFQQLDGRQHDATEFLSILFSIFFVSHYNENELITYYYKNKTDSHDKYIKNDTESFSTDTINHVISIFTLKELEFKSNVISYFCNYIDDQKLNDDSYYTDPGYNIYKNDGELFVKNIDTQFSVPVSDSENAIKIEKKCINYKINNANNVFFNLSRLLKLSETENEFVKTRIIPEKNITLENGTLTLIGIIIWHDNHYVTFINYEHKEQWYLYDDLFNPVVQSDYIIPIGDYNNLLEYSYKGIKQVVITNSVILWYSNNLYE